MMNLTTTWKTLPPLAKTVVVIVLVVALYFIAWKPLKKIFDKIRVNARLNEFEADTIPTGNGTNINAGIVAAEVYDAIYNNDFFGWTEDETRVVNTLKPIPQAYMPLVADAYKSLYNKVLQEDVINALDVDEWNEIKHLFD